MEPKTLAEALDWIEWYVYCLESIQQRMVVRGLAEAKAGYDAATNWIEDRLGKDGFM